MAFVSRLLLLAGAAGVALSSVLPWVTVRGPSLALHLGLIGADVAPGARTVNGTETSLWPVLLAAGGLVAILGVFGLARKLLLAVGLLVVAGGGALLYYVSNVVEIEANGRGAIEKLLAHELISSTAGPGPPVLIASGIAIVAGALLA